MADPIPNLYDKYGGSPIVINIVKDFSSSLLVHTSLRRYFDSMPKIEIASLNLELVSLALGYPLLIDKLQQSKLNYAALKLSAHAYEELISILRHTLLKYGFASRDASIAINVLDMHAESLLDVRIGRIVTSPFAGVDRRRLQRNPESTDIESSRKP
jgi:hypothetical protein